MLELVDSQGLLGDGKELRLRLYNDGYVFFRQLISRSRIEDFTDEIMQVLLEHGWFAGPLPSLEDFKRPPRIGAEGRGPYGEPGYEAAMTLSSLQELPFAPELLSMMQELVDESVFPLPAWALPTDAEPYPARASVLRIVYPNDLVASHNGMLEHQDFRAYGTIDMFTVWLPLIPITPTTGGLVIRVGGHRRGSIPRRPLQQTEGCATATYLPGDALVFHALTPHAALPNRSKTLRLSIDFRYQSARTPVIRPFRYGARDRALSDTTVEPEPWRYPIPLGVTWVEHELFGPEPTLTASQFVPVPGFPDPLSRPQTLLREASPQIGD